jgi:hypothetical protein
MYVCVCVRIFSAAILYSFCPLGENPSKPLSLSLLHRHRLLASFLPARESDDGSSGSVISASITNTHFFYQCASSEKKRSQGSEFSRQGKQQRGEERRERGRRRIHLF